MKRRYRSFGICFARSNDNKNIISCSHVLKNPHSYCPISSLILIQALFNRILISVVMQFINLIIIWNSHSYVSCIFSIAMKITLLSSSSISPMLYISFIITAGIDLSIFHYPLPICVTVSYHNTVTSIFCSLNINLFEG